MKFHRTKLITTIAFVALASAALTLSGCSSPATEPTPASASDNTIVADHGLSGLNTKQIIERLDTMPVADRPTDLVASIRPGELYLTDDQERELSLPMPSDQFYASIAPYVNTTHECYFHSLTTCLGELQNKVVSVTVMDGATGETVIDETLTTQDNGFVGLWLPRGITGTVSVEYEGLRATSDISTAGDDDPTCLTTLQLS